VKSPDLFDLLATTPFGTVADQAPAMLWLSDTDGQSVLLNHGWRHFRGLRDADEVADGWAYGIHADDVEAVRGRFAEAHRDQTPFAFEYRVRRADGEYRWIDDRAAPWRAPDGQFLGHLGLAVDVTDRRAHHIGVQAPEHRLKQLVESSRDMVYRLRLVPSMTIEYAGGAVEAITGHSAAEFYADPTLVRRVVHPDDLPLLVMTVNEAAAVPGMATYRWVHPGGRVVWAEHYRIPIFDAAGRVVGLEGLARDITARLDGERRLRESEEQLRQLAARVESAREEERTEVSRELHDELGQTLTALKLEINRTIAAFASDAPSVHAVNRCQSVVGLVDIAIGTVKRISARLRPATLDHLGLVEAVRWEAQTFKARTGIRCAVRANRESVRLSAEAQTALFRILQEALNNVVCHASASAVQITITETDRQIELRVRDNGRGITREQAGHPASIGLLGMKERAALVGGSFAVTGQKGKGTLVSVHVPVTTAAEHRRREAAEFQP
jgi:PAS domain S-box-containing protein